MQLQVINASPLAIIVILSLTFIQPISVPKINQYVYL